MTDLHAEACAEIEDAVTIEDLAECLTHLNCYAKRQPCVIGTGEHPSTWDKSHQQINSVLDDWSAKSRA